MKLCIVEFIANCCTGNVFCDITVFISVTWQKYRIPCKIYLNHFTTALTSCRKLEKTNEGSLRYLRTDHGPRTNGPTDGRTNGQGRLSRTPSGKPEVQKSKIQKSGLYKFLWFLFTVTMPKIRKFC